MSSLPEQPRPADAFVDPDGTPPAGGIDAAAPQATATPEPTEAEADELARLQAELTALRTQVGARSRRGFAVTALRTTMAAVLVMLAAFLSVTSVVGLWAANTTLNTDRWVATIAPLPKDPQVAAAVAQYATTEVFRVVDLEQRLRTVLPEQAGVLVGPVVGQVRDYVRKTVTTVVQSDRFQVIWIEVNRRAHQQAMAILQGNSTVLATNGDMVKIDLLPLINQALRELSSELPNLFGRQITLPDISSGEIPANLRGIVENALGVTLPPNFAQFTFYDGGKLQAVQQALVTAKRGLALLVIVTLVLLLVGFVVSPRRRRTALQLGMWLVIAAVSITATLRAVRRQLEAQVPPGTYRDGVSHVIGTVTGLLRERGVQIIWLGVILALVAYLVGPGRLPQWIRRHVSTGARAIARGGRVAVAHGPGWIARHLDPVRVAGVIVAVVAALLLSSWTGLFVVVIALAAFEVGVTVVARTAGAAPTPDTGSATDPSAA
ncbi:MAG TPA: hypothetical protein VI011_03110 [Asanoa sp.]